VIPSPEISATLKPVDIILQAPAVQRQRADVFSNAAPLSLSGHKIPRFFS
jgi:hypothetical protein